MSAWRRLAFLLLLALATLGARQSAFGAARLGDECRPASAVHLTQARNPFAIAGREGGGGASGLAGLILAWQDKFHVELQRAAKAIKSGGSAFWSLAVASFAYGVFHAAGPGHGKAVLASYMLASRVALRRGVLLAMLAALLQGCVAIALVWIASSLLGATATTMKSAASAIEIASYAAIALLGAALMWKRGRALFAAMRAPPTRVASRTGVYCEAVSDAGKECAPGCGHDHSIDPAQFEKGFVFNEALGAVVAAGLRPCSGAILILVFTLAQDVFWAGIAATLMMALGTAVTTGSLAAVAVYARRAARSWSAPQKSWLSIAGGGVELAAAAVVFFFGVVMLAGLGWSSGA